MRSRGTVKRRVSATGALFATEMFAVSVLLNLPSDTVSVATKLPSVVLVNVGVAVAALVNVPPVTVHWYVSGSKSGSVLADPSKISVWLRDADKSMPALALGALRVIT